MLVFLMDEYRCILSHLRSNEKVVIHYRKVAIHSL